MSRWLVTGSAGMLGQDLVAVLVAAGHEVTRAPRAALDVTDLPACRVAVRGHDVVVNAAAWTAVDDAETCEAQAFAVNATGAANVARACAEAGAQLVQVSTDYVFAGDARSPYDESAAQAPRSAYGRTKAAGEWAVAALCPSSWVVRTAWLYGSGGPNFVSTMGRLATSAGETTWYGLAREVFAGLGLDPDRVRPTTTAAFPRPAPRPAYSVLGHGAWQRVGLAPLRDWRPALAEALPSVVPSR